MIPGDIFIGEDGLRYRVNAEGVPVRYIGEVTVMVQPQVKPGTGFWWLAVVIGFIAWNSRK